MYLSLCLALLIFKCMIWKNMKSAIFPAMKWSEFIDSISYHLLKIPCYIMFNPITLLGIYKICEVLEIFWLLSFCTVLCSHQGILSLRICIHIIQYKLPHCVMCRGSPSMAPITASLHPALCNVTLYNSSFYQEVKSIFPLLKFGLAFWYSLWLIQCNSVASSEPRPLRSKSWALLLLLPWNPAPTMIKSLS